MNEESMTAIVEDFGIYHRVDPSVSLSYDESIELPWRLDEVIETNAPRKDNDQRLRLKFFFHARQVDRYVFLEFIQRVDRGGVRLSPEKNVSYRIAFAPVPGREESRDIQITFTPIKETP